MGDLKNKSNQKPPAQEPSFPLQPSLNEILSEIDVSFRDPVFLYEDDCFRKKDDLLESIDDNANFSSQGQEAKSEVAEKMSDYDFAATLFCKYRQISEAEDDLKEKLQTVTRLKDTLKDRVSDVELLKNSK
ncbi:unnamed protein product [Soboliphyme baturini]|uniref:ING domain-containing protein n=1 Tax=Soboliphyme baturini TaxID=241478 RepID=A0A183IW10_9BILA|nr:unnamed protein product [Soboliphyme baturini]